VGFYYSFKSGCEPGVSFALVAASLYRFALSSVLLVLFASL